MAENHVLLETIQLTQSAASITLDNIPQTGYTDLKIVGSVRSDYSGQAIALRINPNGSTANMASRVILGNGSYGSPSSFSDTIAYASAVADTSTANTYNNVEWYIPNYTSSSNKPISVDFVTETNAAAAIMGLSGGIWSVSSAITSLVIQTTAGNLMSGSTFSLYGVAAVGTTPVTAPKATGGNIVANDGTYWYHAFLTSGFFTPQTAVTADVLVVAGGGGGGYWNGGGGGAGGLLTHLSQSLTATNYSVTVGSGGAGATTAAGSFGSNSQFGSLTASVGGGGGAQDSTSAANGGGSGGGAGFGGAGGNATSGQGNVGGNGDNAGPVYGGGGGGAGGAGTAGTVDGKGGIGFTSSLTNAMGTATLTGQLSSGNYYYAGGGSGGNQAGTTLITGGLGGGGTSGTGYGATVINPTAGTANTGGGGGGGTAVNPGAAGGRGIVIVRYAMV